jgi:hypothetical protein
MEEVNQDKKTSKDSFNGIFFLIFAISALVGAFIQANPYGLKVDEKFSTKERQERAFFVEYALNRVLRGDTLPTFNNGSLILKESNFPVPEFRSDVTYLKSLDDEKSVRLVESIDGDLVDLVSSVVKLRNQTGLTNSGESLYSGIVEFHADKTRVGVLILLVVLVGIITKKIAYPSVIILMTLVSTLTIHDRGDMISKERKIDPMISNHIVEFISKRCENKHCGELVYRDNCLHVIGGKICELNAKQKERLSTIKTELNFNIPEAIIKDSKFKEE